MTTRLENIATRQSKTRVRDAFFAMCIAFAAAVSITTVSTASHAASSSAAGVNPSASVSGSELARR